MKLFRRPKRAPDVVIGPADDPYMERWHVIPRNRWFNIYLHKISRSDDDRALHDHVADNLSIVLSGAYLEHLAIKNVGRIITEDYTGPEWSMVPPSYQKMQVTKHIRTPGAIVFRKAEQPHRLELGPKPVWTLWIKFRERRLWGFWPQGKWMHWEEYLKQYGKENQTSTYTAPPTDNRIAK